MPLTRAMTRAASRMPVQAIRLYGGLAEQQVRLMTMAVRTMFRPHPLVAATLRGAPAGAAPVTPASRPAPKPRASRPEVVVSRPRRVSDTTPDAGPATPVPPAATLKPAVAKAGKPARRRPSPPPAMPGAAE